jgi:hypothetical protein
LNERNHVWLLLLARGTLLDRVDCRRPTCLPANEQCRCRRAVQPLYSASSLFEGKKDDPANINAKLLVSLVLFGTTSTVSSLNPFPLSIRCVMGRKIGMGTVVAFVSLTLDRIVEKGDGRSG